MAERKHRKAINFDLDTKKLNQNGFKNTRPAYAEIRRIFKELGFEHRQYSGYVSVVPLTKLEVKDAAKSLSLELPWLFDCVQKFDVTDIGKEYDLTDVLKNAAQLYKDMTLPRKVLE